MYIFLTKNKLPLISGLPRPKLNVNQRRNFKRLEVVTSLDNNVEPTFAKRRQNTVDIML